MGQAPASCLVPKPLGSGDPAMSSGPTSTVQACGAPIWALASCPEESTRGSPATDAPSTGPVPGSVGWLPGGGVGTDGSDRGAAPRGPLLSRGVRGCVPPPPPDLGTGAGVQGSWSSTLPATTSCPGGLQPGSPPGSNWTGDWDSPPRGGALAPVRGKVRLCAERPGGQRGSTELPEGLPGRPRLQEGRAGPGPAQMCCLDTEGRARPSDANLADGGQEVERQQRWEGPRG